MRAPDRYHAVKNITLVGALVNFVLAVSKLVASIWGNSHALFADGMHSLSDLLTDCLVIIAARYAHQGADQEHPYGHGRIETAATLFLAISLSLVGVGIIYNAIYHGLYEQQVAPAGYVPWVIVFSILANEFLYHITVRVGNRYQSDLLIANAWHHRSDALSSFVVLMGVGAALLGFTYLDTLAAMIVGVMIVKMGWSLGWSSMQELVDASVAPNLVQGIHNIIQQIPGIITLHQLRTRSHAGDIFLDVHIQVDKKITVSEGHYIAQQVHAALKRKFKSIKDVTVHVDPEDDEEAMLNLYLPSRPAVLEQLKSVWGDTPWADDIKLINMHYLEGKIDLEVYLKSQANLDPQILIQAVSEIDFIGTIDVYQTNLDALK